MYSARRIFIAGSAVAADDTKALDALASHTQHLNLANTPALEVWHYASNLAPFLQ